MKSNEEKMKSFEIVVKPLIQWLNENLRSRFEVKIIFEPKSVTLGGCIYAVQTLEFVKK